MTLPVRYRTPAGLALVSVTQVLTVAGRIHPEWFTPEAAARGQAVHAATEDFDAGRPIRLAPEYYGYLDAYAGFVATVRPRYKATEQRVENLTLGLAGRIDRVCLSLYGRPALVDLKTGAPSAWHGLQLAAYNRLLPTGPRYGVYLKPTGGFHLHLYDDPLDHWRFLDDWRRVRMAMTLTRVLTGTGDDVWQWEISP